MHKDVQVAVGVAAALQVRGHGLGGVGATADRVGGVDFHQLLVNGAKVRQLYRWRHVGSRGGG